MNKIQYGLQNLRTCIWVCQKPPLNEMSKAVKGPFYINTLHSVYNKIYGTLILCSL